MGNVIFAASKILWVVAAPGNLLLLVLLFGVVCLVVGKPRHGLAFVLVASLAFLSTATLPVASWLAAPLENRFPALTTPPERVDGIIVLGGAVDPDLTEARGPVALNEAAERITEAVALALRYPQARVLLSGGDGRLIPKGLKEADATRRLFIELGVAPDRIIL
ncbi:MAG: YdcF family protein, partial [Alphaproteobacteria bacterium]|nr:YdcF family protein [Alphaproteobacteria bacterium]